MLLLAWRSKLERFQLHLSKWHSLLCTSHSYWHRSVSRSLTSVFFGRGLGRGGSVLAHRILWIVKWFCILLCKVHTFFIENDAEMLPAHYTWNLALTCLIHKQSIQVKLKNEGEHYTHMHTILDKIQYILVLLRNLPCK